MAGGLQDSLRIFRTAEAARYATRLFRESFGAGFPKPSDGVLPVPTPTDAWRQFVAVYRWPDGSEETVGFLNWIRYRDVYLAGGLCVQKTFYRRLPREQFAECQASGGIAQMMLHASMAELQDCLAWFGYSGDKKAIAAILRAGYQHTRAPHLVVKWRAILPLERKEELVAAVQAVGAF